jgi:hypothetical protein
LSTTVEQSSDVWKDRRDARFDHRAFLWSESSLDRIRKCGRRRVDKEKGIGVVVNDGTAHLNNLQLCGSVHACPVCMVRIREERSKESEQIVTRHIAAGGGAYFLTMTLPHDQGDELGKLLDAVADSFTYCHRGSRWVGREGKRPVMGARDRYGVSGYIRALDLTHGRNGWHPHLHVLVLTDKPLSEQDQRGLLGYYRTWWAKRITHHGYRIPKLSVGCTMEPVRSSADVGAYIAKVTAYGEALQRGGKVRFELTRPDLKTGRYASRNPFQILACAALGTFDRETGERTDLGLWREYEQATHGRRAITFSRGLKARYGVEEKTDEEINNEPVGGDEVTELTVQEYAAVSTLPGGIGGLLRAAEVGGAFSVVVYVVGCQREQLLRKRAPVG